MVNVSHVPPTVCQVTLMFSAPAKVAFTGHPKMQPVMTAQVKLPSLLRIVGVNAYCFLGPPKRKQQQQQKRWEE